MPSHKFFGIALLGTCLFLVGNFEETRAKSLWKKVETPKNPQQEFAAPAFVLAKGELEKILKSAPVEFDSPLIKPAVISLPMPDGSLARFEIVESRVMAPELAARFPEIKTYAGRGVDDRSADVRLDWSPLGLHARIRSPNETICIEPVSKGETNFYLCHRKKRSAIEAEGFQCLTGLEGPPQEQHPLAGLGFQRGGRELRTYRLAVAASGEFTQAQGGTVESAMAVIAGTVNEVNGIYQAELGVRLVLVANNHRVIYTNPDSDPYSQNGPFVTTLQENQNTLDSVIGSANYDVGHVFNTGQFGVANIGVVCVNGWKGRGCVGTSTPGADVSFARYVAHEIAHQFGAHHTFNSQDGLCGGGRNPGTAYEPGSGSTLMGYAGFCSGDNLQEHPDAYFHWASYDEIMNFLGGGAAATGGTVTPTGNNPPQVEAGANYVIPKETPFRLVASGSDPDGDNLTFCWEERDLGPVQGIHDGDNGSSPLFRSHTPTSSRQRTFPRMSELLNNTRLVGEQLPTSGRTMKFRVTARDGRGGIGTSDMEVTVAAQAGPFVVTSHNSGEAVSGVQTITWDVAGTSQGPVGAGAVNILLSTNGGNSFDIVLAANTSNDGSEAVRFPSISVSEARIKVEAAGNIFFDVNDGNFSIFPSAGAKPDVNGDGQTDLIWQSSRGQLAAWFMNGMEFSGVGMIHGGHAVPGWRLSGFSDFDLDGQVDFLWQDTGGRLAVWFMDGMELRGGALIRNGASAGPGWKMVGVCDFDANGQGDFLFQHDDGRLRVWFMSGVNVIREGFLNGGQPVPGWRVIGLEDFNADGRADLLWRSDAGRLAVWFMNGARRLGVAMLNNGQPVSLAWRVVALNDFDGDGQTDLLWQNGNGLMVVWFMNGTTFLRTALLGNGKAISGWQVAGPR